MSNKQQQDQQTDVGRDSSNALPTAGITENASVGVEGCISNANESSIGKNNTPADMVAKESNSMIEEVNESVPAKERNTFVCNTRDSSPYTGATFDAAYRVSVAQGSNSGVVVSTAADTDSEVDSALIAGMRDARERVALLRLENSFIDFMKSDSGWLEVGGPYNSVVLSPSSVNSTAPNNYSNNYFPDSNVPGQRQTSFQKCILHRLADRFGIVREPGSLLPGSIRLIKLPASKIPTKLLQHLDPAEYALNSNSVYDTRQQYDSSYYTKNNTGADQLQLNAMNRSFANASLAEPKDGILPPTGSSTNMKPGKMKIMKRSDKSKPSPRDNPNKNQRNYVRRNSSEISDKEKAYAEARARIFNEEGSSSNLIDEGDKNSSSAGQNSDSNIISRSNSAVADSNASSHFNVSCETSKVEMSDDNPSLSANKSSSNSLRRLDSSGSISKLQMQSEMLHQNQGESTSSNLPQLETKAVYRNRAEEAADPDFRRHRPSAPVLVPKPTMFGMGTVGTAVPSHAAPSAVPYGVAATGSAWGIVPASVPYPLMPAQQQVGPPQSVSYFGVPRHQQSFIPSQHQQSQFHLPHQPYTTYPLHQQSLQHPNVYDPVSAACVVAPQSSVASTGKLYQHSNNNIDYSNRSNGSSGNPAVKHRPGTLTAAAPAFYPPSIMTAGSSSDRNSNTSISVGGFSGETAAIVRQSKNDNQT